MGDFNRDGGFDRRRSNKGRFDRRSGGFDRRGRDRNQGRDRRSERHEMHSGICDKCGNECEVPFKPTQGKPLYCNDCFKDKSREAGSRSEFGRPSGKSSDENQDQINKKLDRILKILEEHVKEKPKKTEQPDLEEPKLEYAKSIEKKKPKKKKTKKKS